MNRNELAINGAPLGHCHLDGGFPLILQQERISPCSCGSKPYLSISLGVTRVIAMISYIETDAKSLKNEERVKERTNLAS